jgi:hypothetical protein
MKKKNRKCDSHFQILPDSTSSHLHNIIARVFFPLYRDYCCAGQGSDPTGSDTSTWSDQERARQQPPPTSSRPSQPPLLPPPPSGYQPPPTAAGWGSGARFTSPSPDRGGPPPDTYGYARRAAAPGGHNLPPYRHPPQPGRLPSPGQGGEIPPPYRDPPPPPSVSNSGGGGGSFRNGGLLPTSPTQGRHMSLPPPHPPPHSPTPPRSGYHPHPALRAPHYSPPPHHRELPGRGHAGGYGAAAGSSRGPSPGRGNSVHGPPSSSSRIQGSPARGHSSPSASGGHWRMADGGGGGSSQGDPFARAPTQQASIAYPFSNLN